MRRGIEPSPLRSSLKRLGPPLNETAGAGHLSRHRPSLGFRCKAGVDRRTRLADSVANDLKENGGDARFYRDCDVH
jgi:hypothetical protein